jgi:hypothetical protein
MGQLSVVCVQTGNYLGRGAEYVKKLRRQVRKHLTLPHEFVVMTDDPASFYPRMKCRPSALPGWWEKLRLFKPGMFPEGRVIFFDLDTFIVGNIDDIASHESDFSVLHDFWRPKGLGPAVMMWRSGWGADIWDAFVDGGQAMRHANGDQGFLEAFDGGRLRREATILQEAFPGRFVSYKTHCANGIPEGASVICFHGKPRPHEAGGWASEVWNG